jgi:type IV pilus assembly protein PilA
VPGIQADKRDLSQYSGWIGLAVVIAAFLILVAVGQNAFRDARVRSQVSEGVILADTSKNVVDDYVAKYHAYPLDNRQAGMPSPDTITDRHVVSVTISRGSIITIYGNKADERIAGRKLVFSPPRNSGSTKWTGNSEAGTTVDAKYLPPCCRSAKDSGWTPEIFQENCTAWNAPSPR